MAGGLEPSGFSLQLCQFEKFLLLFADKSLLAFI